MRLIPSAPAASQALAISVMSVTLGESLIKRKRATEVKNVDFDLLQGNIKYIGDVEDKK